MQSPGTFLSGNITNNHEGYGINAVEGVESDINYARGNLNPAQCLNVICVPGTDGRSKPPAGPAAPGAGAAPPGAGHVPTAADLTAPALAVVVKTRQRLGKTLRVAVSAGEDVWASARGKLRIAGRPYRLRHIVGRLVARRTADTQTGPPADRARSGATGPQPRQTSQGNRYRPCHRHRRQQLKRDPHTATQALNLQSLGPRAAGRTISTFSCDIAYSRSPTASKASSALK